jgi:hypothetical protein
LLNYLIAWKGWEFNVENLGEIVGAVSQIVGAAAVLAAFIPQTKAASPILGMIRKGLDLLAFNVLNAKNRKPD